MRFSPKRMIIGWTAAMKRIGISVHSRFLYRSQTSRFFHCGGFSSSCRSSTLVRPSVLSVHSQPALLCTRLVLGSRRARAWRRGRWHRGQRLLARPCSPCSPFHSAAVVGHGRRCCSRGLAAGRRMIAGSM